MIKTFMVSACYVGDDIEYIEAGKGAFSEFHVTQPSRSITQTILEKRPLIVLLDLTNKDVLERLEVNMIPRLKSHSEFKSLLFVAILKDKEHFQGLSWLLHTGISYFHYKGTEIHQLFMDAYYTATDDNPGFISFARMKNVLLPYTASVPGRITDIDGESLQVSCDLEDVPSPIMMTTKFLDTSRTDSYEVLQRIEGSDVGQLSSSFRLQFPYPGPWDEVKEDSMLPDTVETWLNEYGNFRERKKRILLHTENKELYLKLSEKSEEGGSRYFLTNNKIGERIKLLKPECIILDFPPAVDELDFHEGLKGVIEVIKSFPEYGPYLLVFRSKFDSEALKADFGYPKILGHQKECSIDQLERIFETLQMKMKPQPHWGKLFKLDDEKGEVEIALPVYITSLSEHEVTFFCSQELTMYSILKFDVPVRFLALIVPPLKELYKGPKGTHYMAFINGIDQDDLAKLRIYVNKSIYTPPKVFEAVEEDLVSPLPITPEAVDEAAASEIEKESEEVKPFFKLKKREFRYSKL